MSITICGYVEDNVFFFVGNHDGIHHINSGHHAGFAYKGLEPYEIEHMVKIGILRCEFQRQEGVLLNHETTVLLVTGYI